MEPGNPYLSVVVMGDTNSGKSTLVGRVLQSLGLVSEDTWRMSRRIAMDTNTEDYIYAWLLDTSPDERARGFTHFSKTKYVKGTHCNYYLIDTPSFHQCTRELLSSISQADAVIYVTDILNDYSTYRFKTHFSKIIKASGIKQAIICINKFESRYGPWGMQEYQETRSKILDIIAELECNDINITMIPISALRGDNVIQSSGHLSWFQGPTFYQSLENLHAPPRTNKGPLRIPIDRIYSKRLVGTVVTGRVESGSLKSGMTVKIMPSHIIAVVGYIEHNHERVEEAFYGDIIGFHLLGVNHRKLRKGYMVSELNNCHAKECERFIATINVVNSKVGEGYCIIVNCHTAQASCRITEIIQINQLPRMKTEGEVVERVTVELAMKPLGPLCLETFEDYPKLGRIFIRDNSVFIGFGIVTHVTNKDNVYLM